MFVVSVCVLGGALRIYDISGLGCTGLSLHFSFPRSDIFLLSVYLAYSLALYIDTSVVLGRTWAARTETDTYGCSVFAAATTVGFVVILPASRAFTRQLKPPHSCCSIR